MAETKHSLPHDPREPWHYPVTTKYVPPSAGNLIAANLVSVYG